MFWKSRSGDDRSAAADGASSPTPEKTTESPTGWDPSDPLAIGAQRELTIRSLVELSDVLNAQMDVFEITDVAEFNLMGRYGCSKAALWLVMPDAKDAVLIRSYGFPARAARAVGSVWVEWLQRTGFRETMRVDAMKEVGSVPGLPLAEEAGIAVFAPIVSQRKLIGALALGERVGGQEFKQRDLETLEASLNFIGIALENASFTNRMTESNRQLRAANDRLQELDTLKSEFLRNLNHELRTPLTVISAYVDSLQLSESTSDAHTEHVQALREQTTKLESLVMRLLDFGKMMDDTLELEASPVDLVSTLRRFCEERRPGIAAELRELRFSHGSQVPSALADRERVVQIVQCLVENAVKFCPGGSRIHVRVDVEGDRVRVDVGDDGPGIAPDQLPHIFDTFRQGDGSATRVHGGVGMGLSFARELAQRMSGALDVDTELGRGTIFSLRLPTG